MSSSLVLGLLGSVALVAVLVELMRRRHLREKYAVTWFLVAAGVLLLTVAPGLLTLAADVVGVEVPANLLFFAASMVLLILTLQHSYELGRLEERSRTLAEELALMRLDLESLRAEREDPDRP